MRKWEDKSCLDFYRYDVSCSVSIVTVSDATTNERLRSDVFIAVIADILSAGVIYWSKTNVSCL